MERVTPEQVLEWSRAIESTPFERNLAADLLDCCAALADCRKALAGSEERAESARRERDSLRLELHASEANRLKGNAELIAQRDAARAQLAEARKVVEPFRISVPPGKQDRDNMTLLVNVGDLRRAAAWLDGAK